MSIVSDLKSDINSILVIRDDIGAGLKPVEIVTKTWSGTEPGDGTVTETVAKMLPSPRVVEFMDNYKIREGGAVQQGDIVLKMISKQTYTTRESVDCSVDGQNIEKYYRVGGILYRVIHVKEKHVVWEVHLRRISQQ